MDDPISSLGLKTGTVELDRDIGPSDLGLNTGMILAPANAAGGDLETGCILGTTVAIGRSFDVSRAL